MDPMKAEILEDLQEFPSSFNLRRIGKDERIVKKVINTIRSENIEDPTPFYEHTDNNLLSYLLVETGSFKNKNEAKELNKKVRESEPENIIAATNCVHILVRAEDFARARTELEKLKRAKKRPNFASLLTKANAELAYSYSRFGPQYHADAVELYEKVLVDVPDNVMWTYRYGVVLQRCLNMQNIVDKKDFDGSAVFLKALDVLLKVTQSEDKTLAAKAWVKIGSSLRSYKGMPQAYKPTDTDGKVKETLSDVCKSLGIEFLDILYCMQTAVSLAPEDRTVLQECGRFYRLGYHRDLRKARQYLEKSYEIHPTTFNCIQLALLEEDEWNIEKVADIRSRYGGVCRYISFEGLSEARHDEQEVNRRQLSLQETGEDLKREPLTRAVEGLAILEKNEPTAATGDVDSDVRTKMNNSSRRPEWTTAEYANSEGTIVMPQPKDIAVHRLLNSFMRSATFLKKEYDPMNGRLNKALELLEEAHHLCNSSDTVLSLKGRIYRRLNNGEDAIKCFKEVVHIQKQGGSNLLTKVNVYEQQGYCYTELANHEQDESKKKELIEDAIIMFFLAIENAVYLDLPFEYECPSSDTLHDLLHTKSRESPGEKGPYKQLSRFHKLFGNVSEALCCLDNVVEIDPLDFDAYSEKARILIASGANEEALCFLTLLLRTVHRDKVLSNKSLLFQAALGAAVNNLREQKLDVAREYFGRAYEIAFDLIDKKGNGTRYDVYITGKETEGGSHFTFFADIIEKYFGLSSFSSADVEAGEYANCVVSAAMDDSRNFLFIFPDSEDNQQSLHYRESVVSCIQKRVNSLHSLTVVHDSPESVPQSLKHQKYSLVSSFSDWTTTERGTTLFANLLIRLFKAIINFGN